MRIGSDDSYAYHQDFKDIYRRVLNNCECLYNTNERNPIVNPSSMCLKIGKFYQVGSAGLV